MIISSSSQARVLNGSTQIYAQATLKETSHGFKNLKAINVLTTICNNPARPKALDLKLT